MKANEKAVDCLIKEMRDRISLDRKIITDLEQKIAKAVEALKFYKDKKSWKRLEDLGSQPCYLNDFLNPIWAPIVKDSGNIAKQTLKEIGEE